MTAPNDRLAEISRRYNLLEHSFYQRWLAGELSRAELNDYAGQYAHVVAGLPRWLEAAAAGDAENSPTLESHAREEAGHIALWEEFARAVDPGRTSAIDPPNSATRALVERCDALAAGGDGVAVAWAIETQSPEVSATKLRGLDEHYGIDAENGGHYFALHSTRDVDHRAELAVLLAALSGDGAANAADAVLAGIWDLLTSVERAPSPA